MKKARKLFALVIVLSMLCSFALVFSLSSSPVHRHVCPENGCAVCAVVNFAQTLFKAISHTALFSVLPGLLFFGRFVPLDCKLAVKTKNHTPVALKTKITA